MTRIHVPDEVWTTVEQALEAHGWQKFGRRDPFASLGQKFFDTAVGKKSASVILYGSASTTTEGTTAYYILSGTYFSEGSNCLNNMDAHIPVESTLDVIAQRVHKYADDADVAISKTYAMRLARMATETAQEPAVAAVEGDAMPDKPKAPSRRMRP